MESKAPAIYLGKEGKTFGPYTQEQIDELKRTGEYFSYAFIWDPAVSSDWKPINLPPPPPSPPGGSEQPAATEPAAQPETGSAEDENDELAAPNELEIEAEIEPSELNEPVEIEKTGWVPSPSVISATELEEAEPEDTSVPELAEEPAESVAEPAEASGSFETESLPAESLSSEPVGDEPVSETIRDVQLQVICHDNRSVVGGVMAQPTLRGFRLRTNQASQTLSPFGRGSKVWLNLLDEKSGRTENLAATVSGVASRSGKWEFDIVWERKPRLLD